eukprot:16126791-Heterocapsa_arctica.AAC.1
MPACPPRTACHATRCWTSWCRSTGTTRSRGPPTPTTAWATPSMARLRRRVSARAQPGTYERGCCQVISVHAAQATATAG